MQFKVDESRNKDINTLCGMMIDVRKGFLKRRLEQGDGLRKCYFLLNTI